MNPIVVVLTYMDPPLNWRVNLISGLVSHRAFVPGEVGDSVSS
jgi:hypothetical protein